MLTLDDIARLQAMLEDVTGGRDGIWVAEKDVRNGWPICHFGNSANDGGDWTINTEPMHASQLCDLGAGDAKADAEFIACLRNNAADLLVLAAERMGGAFVGQERLPLAELPK